MQAILYSSILLSILHALIPSHWIPIVAIGKKEKWSERKTLWVTMMAGLTHVLSTILLGVLLGFTGGFLSGYLESLTHWVAPVVFISTGIFFLYKNQKHEHFHLKEVPTRWKMPWALIVAMFFSPCLEIEVYFLAAGQYGIGFWMLVALVYMTITIAGMILWMWLVLKGLKKLDWHALEHNAGIIAGITLILTGIAFLFEH